MQQNLRAVDETLAHLFEVSVPDKVTSHAEMPPAFSPQAPQFERDVLGVIYAGHGDEIPVSAFPVDGTFPTGTAKWEKRNIALEIPAWDTKICIQCGKCAMVCPHAVIRIKVYDSKELAGAPATFKSTEVRDKEWKGLKYTIQVAPEDCTGCGICVDICPAKNKSETRLKAINMVPQPPLREPERENWEFFLKIPELDRRKIKNHEYPPATDPGASVRIFGSLLRMRRDALSEAGFAALRRSFRDRQCDRLLFDLRRQPADYALGEECRRPRPSLVEFPVRRQCRVRPGIPALHRQADRIRPRVGAPSGRVHRRGTRHRFAGRSRRKTSPTFSSSASASNC